MVHYYHQEIPDFSNRIFEKPKRYATDLLPNTAKEWWDIFFKRNHDIKKMIHDKFDLDHVVLHPELGHRKIVSIINQAMADRNYILLKHYIEGIVPKGTTWVDDKTNNQLIGYTKEHPIFSINPLNY